MLACSNGIYSCANAMLQAHSLLWHYLWLAPDAISLVLAGALWRTDFRKRYPFFFSYLIFVALNGVCLYVLDLSPRVSGIVWWKAFLVGTVIEGLLKFLVIGELVHSLLQSWRSIATLGRNVVSVAGVLLIFTAAVIGAFAIPETYRLIYGTHILSQTIYLTAAGLIVSLFVLAACFHIPWERAAFGIALGAGFSWCVHLAIFALVTGALVRDRAWQDLAMMAAYHVTVLIWCYYLLVPHKVASPKTSAALPENNLDVWNRELERLLQ